MGGFIKEKWASYLNLKNNNPELPGTSYEENFYPLAPNREMKILMLKVRETLDRAGLYYNLLNWLVI